MVLFSGYAYHISGALHLGYSHFRHFGLEVVVVHASLCFAKKYHVMELSSCSDFATEN
jgi:hypothetical protein